MKTKKHFILGLALAFALLSTLAFALVNVGGKDSSTLLNGKYSYSVFAEEDAGSETTLQQSITATKYMISDDANYMLLVTAFDISKVQDDAQYVIGYSIGVNDETATDYNTTYYYNSISFAEDDVRTVADIFGEGKDKECFYIFDWCRNFEYFEKNRAGNKTVTTMSLMYAVLIAPFIRIVVVTIAS